MASNMSTGPSVSLKIRALDCQNPEADGTTIQRTDILYRPGDIIPAIIEVHKHRTFEALSFHGSLIGMISSLTRLAYHRLTSIPIPGETRVWTRPANRPSLYQTIIHTHLSQSAGFSQTLPSLNATQAGNKLSKPTTFILPELATDPVNKSGISNRLPPSCESGSLYLDPWGRSYAQPLIEYYLQATLKYRVDNETAVRTISAKRRIRITTAPHSEPPEYSKEESKTELVTASAEIRRSRFSKSFAKLSVEMGEPSTVVARNTSGCCQTTGQLQLSWETSSEANDEFELGRRRVEVEYQLQARTRYGTRVVRDGNKSPGDEALETTALGTFEVCATDRNDVRAVASKKHRRGHSGTIPIPVQVAEGAVPTFSHVLASRDYTLLVKVKVQGLQHKGLSLKVPLQVCESSAANDDERVRAKSEVYAKMAVSDVSDTLFANVGRCDSGRSIIANDS
jgi:hypothetical protein